MAWPRESYSITSATFCLLETMFNGKETRLHLLKRSVCRICRHILKPPQSPSIDVPETQLVSGTCVPWALSLYSSVQTEGMLLPYRGTQSSIGRFLLWEYAVSVYLTIPIHHLSPTTIHLFKSLALMPPLRTSTTHIFGTRQLQEQYRMVLWAGTGAHQPDRSTGHTTYWLVWLEQVP